MSRVLRRAGALLLLALLAWPALADWQTRSWSRWVVEGREVHGVFGIERVELRRLGLPDDAQWLVNELRGSLSLRADGQACTLAGTVPSAVDATRLEVSVRFACASAPREVELGVRALIDAAGSPMHYASLAWSDGVRADALFTRAADTHAFRAATAAVARSNIGTLAAYLALGLGHILAGADHVAFLACMLLVSPRLRHRLWMVTGFTLGHSVTLSLAALDLLHARTAAVEALIGFTVALLAAESFMLARGSRLAGVLLALVLAGSIAAAFLGRLPGMPLLTLLALAVLAPAYLVLSGRTRHRTRLHLGMTAVFGLVHGLGFASVLRALGLPDGQRGWALAGFNLGVEAGQVALLLAMAGIMIAVERAVGVARRRSGEQALAALLCALGVFWFVGRSAAY